MIAAKQFVELNKSQHERKSFDCGQESVNRFLWQFAVRHREAGISKTMVLPVQGKPKDICAYYTLSHSEIKRQTLPHDHAKKLPYYPVPVMLITQLGVHKNGHGQGLGKITLIAALKQAYAINQHLPSHAVVVDALNQEVQGFYEQYGFKLLGQSSKEQIRLFLPMKTLAVLFGK